MNTGITHMGIPMSTIPTGIIAIRMGIIATAMSIIVTRVTTNVITTDLTATDIIGTAIDMGMGLDMMTD
jgi:hypothetical protein